MSFISAGGRSLNCMSVCVCVCLGYCSEGLCCCLLLMRCAERAGTTMMLWQHEFYMVIEPDPHKPSGAPMPYLYQALEFNLGPNLDPEDVEWAGAKQKKRSMGPWRCIRSCVACKETESGENERGLFVSHRVERWGRGHGVVW